MSAREKCVVGGFAACVVLMFAVAGTAWVWIPGAGALALVCLAARS